MSAIPLVPWSKIPKVAYAQQKWFIAMLACWRNPSSDDVALELRRCPAWGPPTAQDLEFGINVGARFTLAELMAASKAWVYLSDR